MRGALTAHDVVGTLRLHVGVWIVAVSMLRRPSSPQTRDVAMYTIANFAHGHPLHHGLVQPWRIPPSFTTGRRRYQYYAAGVLAHTQRCRDSAAVASRRHRRARCRKAFGHRQNRKRVTHIATPL